jgi:hypothetical protein
VLFPEGNVKDLEEIPEEVRARVRMLPVKTFSEVAAAALAPAAAVLPAWAVADKPSAAAKQPPHSGGVA